MKLNPRKAFLVKTIKSLGAKSNKETLEPTTEKFMLDTN